MRQRKWVTLLTAALCLGLLAGCGSEKSPSGVVSASEPMPAAGSTSTPAGVPEKMELSAEERFYEHIAQPWGQIDCHINDSISPAADAITDSARLDVRVGQVLTCRITPQAAPDIDFSYLDEEDIEMELSSGDEAIAHVMDGQVVFCASGETAVSVTYRYGGEAHTVTLDCTVADITYGNEMDNQCSGLRTLLTDDGTLLATGVGDFDNKYLFYGPPEEFFAENCLTPSFVDILGESDIFSLPSSEVWSLNSLDGVVYYVASDEIRRMAPDFQSYTTVFTCEDYIRYFAIIDGDFVLFSGEGSPYYCGSFTRVTPEGEIVAESEQIEDYVDIRCDGGMLYFYGSYAEKGKGVYRMDLMFHQAELTPNTVPYFGNTHFLNSRTYTLTNMHRLTVTDWATGETETLHQDVSAMVPYGGKIYYTTLRNIQENVALYVYDPTLGTEEMLLTYRLDMLDTDVSALEAQGGRIYFLFQHRRGFTQCLPVYDPASGATGCWDAY